MNEAGPTQLTLGVSLNDEATVENTFVSTSNLELVNGLLAADGAQTLIYLCGEEGVGITHLLQAACHIETGRDHAALYLPLSERENFPPAILEGCNTLSLVCIDDIDSITGDSDWEAALFTAFNSMQESDTRLILAGRASPANLDFTLRDLQSRLQLAPLFQLNPLNDDEKKQLLQLRARQRGMSLSEPIADYILARTERSLTSLIDVLNRLDASTLHQRRALSIPLVRETMGWN